MQQRGLGGGFHVSLGREQPDQARLPHDLAVGVHLAHADVVHARTPVHGRVRVGLAEHQQVPILDATAHGRVQGVQRNGLGERGAPDIGKDAEPTGLHRADRPPLLGIEQLVLAIAEQHEVQLQQPIQEVDGLSHLLR